MEVACFHAQFDDWNRHDEHDAVFLSCVKGLQWDKEDGILRGRPRKEPAPPPPIFIGEDSQTHNPDLPDGQSPKETDNMNDTDNVSMSETTLSDGREPHQVQVIIG